MVLSSRPKRFKQSTECGNLPLSITKGVLSMLEGHEAVDFEPVSDFMLIYKHEKNTTAGGLALPDGVETGPPKGVVVKAGPGRMNELGTALVPMPVQEGDTVYCCFNMMDPRGPPELTFGGKHYMVVAARHLIGKVSQPAPYGELEAKSPVAHRESSRLQNGR
jgi:co-chaperonin GroES (HSP10)